VVAVAAIRLLVDVIRALRREAAVEPMWTETG
jgi:hypothetical protein